MDKASRFKTIERAGAVCQDSASVARGKEQRVLSKVCWEVEPGGGVSGCSG